MVQSETERLQGGLDEALADVTTLAEALAAVAGFGARAFIGHEPLQYLLATEPGTALPHLCFSGADSLLSLAADRIAPHLCRFMGPLEARRTGPRRRHAGPRRLRHQRRDHAQRRPEPGLVGGERGEETLRIPRVPGRLGDEEGQPIDREHGGEAGDVVGRAAAAVQQDRHGAGARERRAGDEDARGVVQGGGRLGHAPMLGYAA